MTLAVDRKGWQDKKGGVLFFFFFFYFAFVCMNFDNEEFHVIYRVDR